MLNLTSFVFLMRFFIGFISVAISIVSRPISIDIYPLNSFQAGNCSFEKYSYMRNQLEECEKNVTEKLIEENQGIFSQSKLKILDFACKKITLSSKCIDDLVDDCFDPKAIRFSYLSTEMIKSYNLSYLVHIDDRCPILSNHKQDFFFAIYGKVKTRCTESRLFELFKSRAVCVSKYFGEISTEINSGGMISEKYCELKSRILTCFHHTTGTCSRKDQLSELYPKVSEAIDTMSSFKEQGKACPEPLWMSDAEYLEGWWPNRKNITSGEDVLSS